jgi:hypothetical protein
MLKVCLVMSLLVISACSPKLEPSRAKENQIQKKTVRIDIELRQIFPLELKRKGSSTTSSPEE